MRKFISLFAILIFVPQLIIAQTPTIGLRHKTNAVSEGYTLFTPEKNTDVYLINNCGETINTWTFSERPGLTCYLLDNGNLLRAGKDSLEIRDWDNNLVWAYDMTGNGLNQHHDIEPLPNGNILCVVNDIYTNADMLAQGRDGTITGPTFKFDKIVEISPVGTNDATIVWEWKFIDHLIQDFDNSKANFGIVLDHPELIDINYDNGNSTDWTHVNGIDYNADLDQILLSTRHLNELYILDHSTTTIEAAGHSGGNSNMGGDILWRWGNPIVYRQGLISDQKLFLQHDAQWVPDGFVDAEKISVFNNGGDGTGDHSSIHLIEPVINSGVYSMNNDIFSPIDFDWSWTGPILGEPFLEGKKCGVQSLENGNLILCENSKGQLTEVTKNGEIVWVYKNPTGSNNYVQFDVVTSANNSIFRGEKYATDFVGFTGKDLTPQAIIEDANLVSDTCIYSLEITEFNNVPSHLKNTVVDNFIMFNQLIDELVIYNMEGRVVNKFSDLNSDIMYINLVSGMYIVESRTSTGRVKKEKIIVK